MNEWMDGWEIDTGCKSRFKDLNKVLLVLDGWVDGWMGVKAVLRITYSNKKNS